MTKTKASTIGWSITAAGIAYYAANFAPLKAAVEVVREAGIIGMSLPWTSRACLQIGDPWLAVLPLFIIPIPIILLLRSPRPILMIVVPAISAIAILAYVVMVKHGVMVPLKQMYRLLHQA